MPIIHGYMEPCRRNEIHLMLMQDGASGHAARDISIELRERKIEVICWPTYLPGLNPIKKYGIL